MFYAAFFNIDFVKAKKKGTEKRFEFQLQYNFIEGKQKQQSLKC